MTADSLQQSAIPGEQRAVLSGGDAGELRVVEAVAVQGVEAEHPHVRGELPEMDVEHETGIAQGRRTNAQRRGDVKRFENRVNRDAVAVAHDVREIDRRPR